MWGTGGPSVNQTERSWSLQSWDKAFYKASKKRLQICDFQVSVMCHYLVKNKLLFPYCWVQNVGVQSLLRLTTGSTSSSSDTTSQDQDKEGSLTLSDVEPAAILWFSLNISFFTSKIYQAKNNIWGARVLSVRSWMSKMEIKFRPQF